MKKADSPDLFDYKLRKDMAQRAPLAARMRPEKLDDFLGQEHIIGEGTVLRRAVQEDAAVSMILWGPPGSGKTTLARIIARSTQSHFFALSAVSAGVAELREVIKKARELRSLHSQKSILFIDEIHRFNKAQQDAVLPYVESGLVTLIGATTENPSFEVNSALLSRSRVYVLKALAPEHVEKLLERALENRERGLGNLSVKVEEDAWNFLVAQSQGDARVALNTLELAAHSTHPDERGERKITMSTMEDSLQKRAALYDKKGEYHYDLISALHKSMRNSDPDASLYWLGRMLDGGEDPLYIARRIVRFASEDVGLADPMALLQAVAAYHAVHFIGLPEGELALAQAAIYMSLAEKSNSLYTAMMQVKGEIRKAPLLPVPMEIRNAVTSLMKEQGYGKGYKYAHDFEGRITDLECLPEALKGRHFLSFGDEGWERQAAERIRSRREGIGKPGMSEGPAVEGKKESKAAIDRKKLTEKKGVS
jgi:putative ATPase